MSEKPLNWLEGQLTHMELAVNRLKSALARVIARVTAEVNIVIGNITNPSALLRVILADCAVIDEYISHLPEALQNNTCTEGIDLTNLPALNPLTALIGDADREMQAEATERLTASIFSIFKVLTTYISNQHAQSIRIQSHYETFVSKYRTAPIRDLPTLLRELCTDIQSITNTMTP